MSSAEEETEPLLQAGEREQADEAAAEEQDQEPESKVYGVTMAAVWKWFKYLLLVALLLMTAVLAYNIAVPAFIQSRANSAQLNFTHIHIGRLSDNRVQLNLSALQPETAPVTVCLQNSIFSVVTLRNKSTIVKPDSPYALSEPPRPKPFTLRGLFGVSLKDWNDTTLEESIVESRDVAQVPISTCIHANQAEIRISATVKDVDYGWVMGLIKELIHDSQSSETTATPGFIARIQSFAWLHVKTLGIRHMIPIWSFNAINFGISLY